MSSRLMYGCKNKILIPRNPPEEGDNFVQESKASIFNIPNNPTIFYKNKVRRELQKKKDLKIR